MQFLFAFFSASISCIIWMYLLTYCMRSGARPDFISHARINVFRGMVIAGILLVISQIAFLQTLLYRDWIIVSMILYACALPFVWRRARGVSLLPFLLGALFFFLAPYFPDAIRFLWGPFHEEIGKWLHVLTNSFPAVMSPFVGVGFAFLENIRYFSLNSDIGYMIARSLFSLPLHLFATFFGFYCYLSLRPRWLGALVGITLAIALHTLYNWSLETSILITIAILICGYMFYGWSLENGWWKRKI